VDTKRTRNTEQSGGILWLRRPASELDVASPQSNHVSDAGTERNCHLEVQVTIVACLSVDDDDIVNSVGQHLHEKNPCKRRVSCPYAVAGPIARTFASSPSQHICHRETSRETSRAIVHLQRQCLTLARKPSLIDGIRYTEEDSG